VKIKLILLVLFFFVSGCAFGNRTDYRGVSNFPFNYNGETHIFIVAHDERPYVLNRDKKPQFVGLSKSIYGIPYNVSTGSNRPLASDFGEMITNTMKNYKINATQIELPFDKNTSSIFSSENLPPESKVMIFQIKEWKTEAHFRVGIHYNIELATYNNSGNKLADTSINGFDYFNQNNPKRANLAVAYADIVGGLINNPDIISSLNINGPEMIVAPSVNPEIKPECTTDQILAMKNSGLSDAQIKKACEN